jgi:RecA/RadA recombinase
MKTLDTIYGPDGICKSIIQSDSEHEYVVSLDSELGKVWCTCPLYIFKKTDLCKHMEFMLNEVDYNKMKKRNKFKNFSSGCTTIDTLMGNGFPQGTTVAVYAESGRGKTILSAQLALSMISSLDEDVIVIETEGNREQDYLELLNRFRDRFDVSEDTIYDKLHFYPVISSFNDKTKSMVELLKMVGYKAEIKQSKKGDKYSITFNDCKPQLKEKDLKKAGLLIIDSLTEPLKTTIGHKSQNLPARSELISRFFYKLIGVARDYNLTVLLNHHASVNPMQMFGRDFGKPYGGDEVLYNSKYILAIIDSDMKARSEFGKTARRVMMLKHPYNATVGELYSLNLKKDYGFTEEE